MRFVTAMTWGAVCESSCTIDAAGEVARSRRWRGGTGVRARGSPPKTQVGAARRRAPRVPRRRARPAPRRRPRPDDGPRHGDTHGEYRLFGPRPAPFWASTTRARSGERAAASRTRPRTVGASLASRRKRATRRTLWRATLRRPSTPWRMPLLARPRTRPSSRRRATRSTRAASTTSSTRTARTTRGTPKER